MVFRAVRANGAVKGYVQFCGVALIERMAQVVQPDSLTGSSFPNLRHVFDLLVMDTSKECEEVDWRWIDDRRDPSLSLEQTLRFAPSAWREWVSAGAPISAGLRSGIEDSDGPSDLNLQLARSEAFDDALLQLIRRVIRVGQVITTLSKGRPNRIVAIDSGGLRVETEKSVSQESGPQLVPAWMIIAG
jgi:hypothetical protein